MVGKEQRRTKVATWYLKHCNSAHPLLRNCSLENFPEALSLKIPLGFSSSAMETGTLRKKTGRTQWGKGGKSVGTPTPLHHHDKLEQRQSWASCLPCWKAALLCSVHFIVVSPLITPSGPAPQLRPCFLTGCIRRDRFPRGPLHPTSHSIQYREWPLMLY